MTADEALFQISALMDRDVHYDEHGNPWVSWEALNDILAEVN